MDRVIRSSQDLGEAIRRERTGLNLRQADLARLAGVRQARISELENGVTSARLDTVITVLAALDMDVTITPRRSAQFDPTAY